MAYLRAARIEVPGFHQWDSALQREERTISDAEDNSAVTVIDTRTSGISDGWAGCVPARRQRQKGHELICVDDYASGDVHGDGARSGRPIVTVKVGL